MSKKTQKFWKPETGERNRVQGTMDTGLNNADRKQEIGERKPEHVSGTDKEI